MAGSLEEAHSDQLTNVLPLGHVVAGAIMVTVLFDEYGR